MTTRAQPQSVKNIFAGIIGSKQTEYRGVVMRSRLETDFARQLDAWGIEWRYEPAIFGPVGQGYLPDFQLFREDGHHFVEVKPTLREVPKAKARMEVIWKSYPDAVLVVACGQGSRWFAAVAGGEWLGWVERWQHA